VELVDHHTIEYHVAITSEVQCWVELVDHHTTELTITTSSEAKRPTLPHTTFKNFKEMICNDFLPT